ncbi:hypothetical protein HLI18_33575 [Rhizobium laguerreae]|uniref:hypothetical protein n=1 Tax=Rhizobium laguerreae TaxID=1076926 RepID=UPI001478C351|nr:hypothetical protein [Rhizobium laguerreae]NNG74668.1 hypothetical protein [Rhizobium laguerreae]
MDSSFRNFVLVVSGAVLSLFPTVSQASLMQKVEQVQASTEFASFIKKHGTTEAQSLLNDAPENDGKLAQWGNWGNWGNWNNWNNWGNFARLPQWGNGWNNFLN